MHFVLSPLASAVRHRPGWVLATIAAVTFVLGGFASEQTTDTALTSFAPDSEVADALEVAEGTFGGGGEALQVIVDAGADGNVLGRDGLEAARSVEAAIAEYVAAEDARIAGVSSFAQPAMAALEAQGSTLESATDDEIAAAATAALGGDAFRLASEDADPDAGRARAGLVVVSFPSSLGPGAVKVTSLGVAEAVEQLDVGPIELAPYNTFLLNEDLRASSEDEMGVLLGIALLLILGILLFQYRTISDVLIGLVGLVLAILWMQGIAVVLGPEHLGLTGPFSQISSSIPVLLVGLGIDYAIHLTSRYREERSHGEPPPKAAAMGVVTVGGALALATATTVVGFLTNLLSPLPPMADFGVFTAVGVLAAFIIMTTGVPAARNLLDQRRIRRGRETAAPRASGGLASVIARAAVFAERSPRLVLGGAAVVSVVAAGAATQVSTTFGQSDFIPADSDAAALVDKMDEHFDGDVNEVTFVVLDGDLTDPAALNALLDLHRTAGGIDGVRAGPGDLAQVFSPAGIIAGLASADPELADQLAQLGYTEADGFAADANVAGMYAVAASVDRGSLAGVLGADGRTGLVTISTAAGQEGATVLASDLDAAVEPLRSAGVGTTVASEPLVLEESLDALTDSQIQGIVITLAAALLLLIGYYGLADRKPVLGIITMVPSIAVVAWVLGTMWLLDISFNVLTAMVASLGIGIGVPYGIHITHRFLEDHRRYPSVDEAIRRTVRHSGGAMAGSAATTAGGFGVLIFASLTPMRQFGMIVALTIVYSFLAAVLIQPSCLKLWADWQARTGRAGAVPGAAPHLAEPAGSLRPAAAPPPPPPPSPAPQPVGPHPPAAPAPAAQPAGAPSAGPRSAPAPARRRRQLRAEPLDDPS